MLKISRHLETVLKISRCVENHVKKFQGVLKTMLKISSFLTDQVIFKIGWVVDKVCVYTMKG